MFRDASAQIDRDSAKKVGDGDSRPILGCRISKRSSLYLELIEYRAENTLSTGPHSQSRTEICPAVQ